MYGTVGSAQLCRPLPLEFSIFFFKNSQGETDRNKHETMSSAISQNNLQEFQGRKTFEYFFRQRGDAVAAELQVHQSCQVVQAALLQMLQSVAAQISVVVINGKIENNKKKERDDSRDLLVLFQVGDTKCRSTTHADSTTGLLSSHSALISPALYDSRSQQHNSASIFTSVQMAKLPPLRPLLLRRTDGDTIRRTDPMAE